MNTSPKANPSITMCDLVLPAQTNSHGTLFGGQALEMMDKAAAIVCLRHANTDVVTASTGLEGGISFKEPVHEADIIEIQAEITEVGTSSMETKVDMYAEDPKEGFKRHCTTATFVMVALDDNGNPTEVPKL